MKYKARTKVRAKIMKAIRKYVPIKEPTQYVVNKTTTQASNPNQQGNKNSATTNKLKTLLSLFPYRLTQWDTIQGFTNQTYPEKRILL
jgi:hypothetical protein